MAKTTDVSYVKQVGLKKDDAGIVAAFSLQFP